MEQCSGCRYFKRDENREYLGLCVRFPPQVCLIFPDNSQPQLIGGKPQMPRPPVNHPLNPFVQSTDWCGEYRESVEAKVLIQ